jgi:hypothetical protein
MLWWPASAGLRQTYTGSTSYGWMKTACRWQAAACVSGVNGVSSPSRPGSTVRSTYWCAVFSALFQW